MNSPKIELADHDPIDLKALHWLHSATKPSLFIRYTRAVAVKDEDQILKLEEEDPDLYDLHNELGPCDNTEFFAYQRLIRFRYDFLFKNQTYRAYCEARRTNDIRQQRDIENLHLHVAEVYADWGDLYIEDDSETWLESHRHLFYPINFVKIKTSEQGREEDLTIKIPSSLQGTDLIDKLFFAAQMYARSNRCEPKYEIKKATTSYAELYEKIHRWTMLVDQVEELDVTVAEISRQYYQDSLYEALGVDQGKRRKHELNSEDDLASMERTVLNMLQDYRMNIDQSIDGIFPAKKSKST
ncbi:hypothetical protein [Herbaspirillum sp. NPDC087042]|uniref:hypothetical protein n=1 Tax=Herbaspirillum sp. NPDC087042 TaxID=3364004 RepID=UPI00382E26E3